VDTGRTVVICGVVVLEIADRQVTAERHYWPLADTLVQAGLIGSPPGPAGLTAPPRSANGMLSDGLPSYCDRYGSVLGMPG
jgi:hypothetical protein